MEPYSSTDTIQLARNKEMSSSVPLACPWCNKIHALVKSKCGAGEKVVLVYRICGDCLSYVTSSADDNFAAGVLGGMNGSGKICS